MRYASALCLVGLAACSGEVIQDLGTGGAGAGAATGSGGTTGTGGTGTTSATGGASAGGASTGGAPGSCGLCDPPGTNDTPAYSFHECTPPLEIGCPAQLCTPGATDCSPGYSCDPWGAAACCWCQAAVPACVFTGPAQGPLPEYLKLGQTSGPAGQALELRIEGFPFYVGALFYLARVGASGDLMQLGGSTCSFTVDVPGQPVGRVPVWVSQYGGAAPWVLAGFFEWTGGPPAPACIQPGHPCGPNMGTCCETSDVPMACVAGRCRQL